LKGAELWRVSALGRKTDIDLHPYCQGTTGINRPKRAIKEKINQSRGGQEELIIGNSGLGW